jgi:hypothetical protein
MSNEEIEIIKSCWLQYAFETKNGYWAGGMSILEEIETYLKKKGLMDKNGNILKFCGKHKLNYIENRCPKCKVIEDKKWNDEITWI